MGNRAWCGTRLLLTNPESSVGFAAVRNVHIGKSFVFQVIEMLAIILQACKASTSQWLACLFLLQYVPLKVPRNSYWGFSEK